jgi:hypothetical protein
MSTFPWTIYGRPRVGVRLSVGRGGHAVLSLSVSAGAGAPALRTITIVPGGRARLAARAASLPGGVQVHDAAGHRLRFVARPVSGALAITFGASGSRAATLRLASPALLLSGAVRPALRVAVAITGPAAVRITL